MLTDIDELAILADTMVKAGFFEKEIHRLMDDKIEQWLLGPLPQA